MTPFFIAYPRSGNHWIKGMACAYFDKRKIKHDPNVTYTDVGDDVLFFGGHDLLRPSEQRVLYLYRNPEDVIFSLLKAEQKSNIQKEAQKLRQHLRKFILRGNTTCIKYERLQLDFAKEFAKLVYFFDEDHSFDKDRALSLNIEFSKANLAKLDSKYMNRSLLSHQYQQSRNIFRRQHGDMIRRIVIDDDLFKYFEEQYGHTT